MEKVPSHLVDFFDDRSIGKDIIYHILINYIWMFFLGGGGKKTVAVSVSVQSLWLPTL